MEPDSLAIQILSCAACRFNNFSLLSTKKVFFKSLVKFILVSRWSPCTRLYQKNNFLVWLVQFNQVGLVVHIIHLISSL